MTHMLARLKKPLVASSVAVVLVLVLGGGAWAMIRIGGISTSSAPQQGLTRQYWTGVGGTSVSALTSLSTYPDSPTGTDTLSSFETDDWNNPSDHCSWANNYGERVTGYIVAPETGDYTFWISSDDNSELFLSTDKNSANKQKIANVPGYTGCRQWNKYSSQQSSPVHLDKGQYYYVEALHKEGSGGDSMSVGWRKPSDGSGSSPAEIVPGSVLRTGLPKKSNLHIANLEKGLVAHYSFNGDAKDRTPYGNNGTVHGATLTKDRLGHSDSAMSFNGSGAYVDVGKPSILKFQGSQSMSICAWANPSTASGYGRVFAADAGHGGYGYRLWLNVDGYWGFSIMSAARNGGALYSANVAQLNTWQLVCGMWDGSEMSIYVNGSIAGTKDASVGTIDYSTVGDFAIGGRTNQSTNYFTGDIDDVRIYNRALSQQEIQKLYDSYNSQIYLGGSGQPGSISLGKGLVGRWKFNGNARDATPYSNNGTVHGTTLTADREGRPNSAYSFNGADQDYIYSSIGHISGNAYSIGMWVQTSNTNESISGFTAHVPVDPTQDRNFYIDGNGKLKFRVYDGDNKIVTSSLSISDGKWHHILGTVKNNDSMKLYIDGVLQGSTSISTFYNGYPNGYFTVGIDSKKRVYYTGKIDDARVYNRALNGAEAAALYAQN
jgi:hypothetical protein